MRDNNRIEQAYQLAKDTYATLGVDVDDVVTKLKDVVISLHCWQADDVSGFETPDASLSGGEFRLLEIIGTGQPVRKRCRLIWTTFCLCFRENNA